jgi:uncharacterized protein
MFAIRKVVLVAQRIQFAAESDEITAMATAAPNDQAAKSASAMTCWFNAARAPAPPVPRCSHPGAVPVEHGPAGVVLNGVPVETGREGGEGVRCREGCGACCVAPSISSPIPGMPAGKPAGVRCVQLSLLNRCLLYGKPDRPYVCTHLRAGREMCGTSAEDAFRTLALLEEATRPVLGGHSS